MTWTVHDLGLLPGGIFSIAQAANSNGTVIVGVADADGFGDGHAFWWTAGSGLVDLGVLSGGTQSIAYAVSADGTRVVGQSDGGSAPSGSAVAVEWTVTDAGATVVMTELGFLAGGNNTTAWGISSDGTTPVGSGTVSAGDPLSLPAHPFRDVGGTLTLIALASGNTDGIAQAASSNASVIVGGSGNPADVPWIWTISGTALMELPGIDENGAALALSSDGLTAAGYSTTTSGANAQAFRWTSGAGSVSLGFVGGGDASQATAISGDGTLVAGFSNDGVSPFNQAFVWTGADGIVALPGLNVAAPGGSGHGVSGDGTIIVGASRGNEIEPVQHAVYWTTSTPPPPVPILSAPVALPDSLGSWRGGCGINWKGMALVGDAFSNVVGLSNFGIFNEYGNEMRMLVTTPPVHDDRKRIFVTRFEVEMQAGEGEPDNFAAAPTIALEVSKDGGETWLNLKVFRSMGSAGEYMKRIRWLNLGQSRTWVFRLTYAGQARPAIIGTYLDTYKGLG